MANHAAASTPSEFESSPHHHLDSPIGDGKKRKASEDPGTSGAPTQQRAKRNRYISIACNECKRRKIKCNGQSPCQRCGNLHLECVYAPNCCSGFKDSHEYREMSNQIATLQDHVAALFSEVSSMAARLGTGGGLTHPQQHTPGAIDPNLPGAAFPAHASPPYPGMAPMSPSNQRQRHHTQPGPPTFRGPTSNDFNFGVAKSSLKTMGITALTDGPVEGSGAAGTGTREPSPTVHSPRFPQSLAQQPHHGDKDPIWSVSQEEALRLCDLFEDEMGLMYPVLDIEKIKQYAKKLYVFMEAAARSGLMQHNKPGADALDDEDTSILKLVLATALVTEDAGRSEVGKRMFERVQPSLDTLLLERGTRKGIQMLAMAAMYEFHRDHESTSWRLIGLAARVCLELGLHRRETYEAIQDASERHETVLLFWSIYVLDRRWAFGTGMPFALQDSDIDPMCPKPEGRSPYLSAMIDFSSIGSRVWQSVITTSTSGNAPLNINDMEFLDFQIVQWQQKVPPHLYFDPSELGRAKYHQDHHPTRAGRRLPILLYLRRNQMRMSIYRPVLHTATSIMQHRSYAQKVVDIAKDTIRLLTHIKSTSDLYESQQMLFNAFLASALAVLFLAVAHTPALFGENVREEYYMGIELVRNFSRDSYIGKRLWKTVRVLLDVAPKLGLTAKERELSNGPHAGKGSIDAGRSSAAVAMAGLAGHNVDEMALFHRSWIGPETGGSSTSPEALANNLSNLFEAAGGYYNPLVSGGAENGAAGGGDGLFSSGLEGADGAEYGHEELLEILKGHF